MEVSTRSDGDVALIFMMEYLVRSGKRYELKIALTSGNLRVTCHIYYTKGHKLIMQDRREAVDTSVVITLEFSGLLYLCLAIWILFFRARKQYVTFKYQSGAVGSKLEHLLRIEAAKRNIDFEEYRGRVLQKYVWFGYSKIVYGVVFAYCVFLPFAFYLESPEPNLKSLSRGYTTTLVIFTVYSSWYYLQFRDIRFPLSAIPLPEGVAYV